MYRQFDEQQDNEERNSQTKASVYTDKEDSYDDSKMDSNMQMPCGNIMGTGIKLQIGGRPMMCYPIMYDEPTPYEQNMDTYGNMQGMDCGGMPQCPHMFRQHNDFYNNRPPYNYNNRPPYFYPIRPFYPYVWYNLFPYNQPYPHHPHYHGRDDWE